MKTIQKNEGKLTSEKVGEYQKKGYLKLSGVFTNEEAAAWQQECNRLWQAASLKNNDPDVQFRGHLQHERIADRFDPVIDRSPVFKRLTHDHRILQYLRALTGTDYSLLKEKLITKRPGTMGYGMHQDFAYWTFLNIPADEMISVQVGIDAADQANGALEVFPGLHHKRLPAPVNDPLDVDETKMDLNSGQIIETEPGDLLFFNSLTPHRSGPNKSEKSRRMLYLTYVPSKYKKARERYYTQRDAAV